MLSVEEDPTSDAAARSGTLGAAGAVLSMVIVVVAEVFELGPVLGVGAVSATVFAFRRGISVPSLQPVIVIVKLVPLLALGEKLQLVAVPAFVRSDDDRPLIDSDIDMV